MTKFSDKFSSLSKSIDVQKFISDIKALINPGQTTPEAPEGNEVAEHIAELIGIVNNIADAHAEQAKDIASVNNQLHALYKHVVNQGEATDKAEAGQQEHTEANTPGAQSGSKGQASTQAEPPQSAEQSEAQSSSVKQDHSMTSDHDAQKTVDQQAHSQQTPQQGDEGESGDQSR